MWRSSSSSLLYVRFTPSDLRRYLADPLKSWLQENLTIHRARHDLCRTACRHKRHFSHADKIQNRLQIGINEVHRARRCSSLINSATGNEDRRLAMEQSLRPALGISEGAPAANDL